MATIFQAYDERSGIDVAIKRLYTYYMDNEVIRARFVEEGRIQQMLIHPHIVKVYEIVERPTLAIVMEFVPGATLDEYLAQRGPLDEKEILDIIVPVMSAVGFAHQTGIIHRDIKPSNIIVAKNRDGLAPKVMDFGVAKVKGGAKDLTATGTTVGTLHYMSPEQIVGSKSIDGRADIYSLGVTLYKLTTGEVPFNAPTEFALMMAQVEAPPLPPSKLRPGIAPEMEQNHPQVDGEKTSRPLPNDSRIHNRVVEFKFRSFSAGGARYGNRPYPARYFAIRDASRSSWPRSNR